MSGIELRSTAIAYRDAKTLVIRTTLRRTMPDGVYYDEIGIGTCTNFTGFAEAFIVAEKLALDDAYKRINMFARLQRIEPMINRATNKRVQVSTVKTLSDQDAAELFDAVMEKQE